SNYLFSVENNELFYSYLLSGINITPASQVFLEIYHKSFFIPQPFKIKDFNKLYALLVMTITF
ncbi:hypothetical protein AB4544_25395, partial [Vibrio sp. 10N.222.45.F7]|uniref:hypothetical protein n=1 Tax=Vibrio sp. 10N.222.45.F7 TaxID=3229598 RepID=UPI00354AF888